MPLLMFRAVWFKYVALLRLDRSAGDKVQKPTRKQGRYIHVVVTRSLLQPGARVSRLGLIAP